MPAYTTEQWKLRQTKKPPRTCYKVCSERCEHTVYEVDYCQSINAYHCTCPAFRYCSYNTEQYPNQRTCKHIIAVRGERAEYNRIVNDNNGQWLYKPSKQ